MVGIRLVGPRQMTMPSTLQSMVQIEVVHAFWGSFPGDRLTGVGLRESGPSLVYFRTRSKRRDFWGKRTWSKLKDCSWWRGLTGLIATFVIKPYTKSLLFLGWVVVQEPYMQRRMTRSIFDEGFRT